MRLPFISLLLLAASSPTGAAINGPTLPKEERLVLVQAVVRHADRAATDGCATAQSPIVLYRGLGELSDDGIDNAFQQGIAFKNRYVNEFNFFDKRFLPNQVRSCYCYGGRCSLERFSQIYIFFKKILTESARRARSTHVGRTSLK
ncbi:hypothetical protein PENTCL1PPCAC_3581 [Pristionchus entomophagus]|uniref:acid phosphatase n=1 Tax=Pristionchus entomophagus TaxID=358040 RepID=A0AAV5SDI5_9BILA|nr:hypothetical protein PENTCL1PPCAC_3581 [Pristionchus entomophagus]